MLQKGLADLEESEKGGMGFLITLYDLIIRIDEKKI